MATSVHQRYKLNQKLLLELVNGDVIEGEFVQGSSTKLTLRNCVQTSANIASKGLQHFYNSEINNVTAFPCTNGDVQSPSSSSSHSDCDSIIKISEDEYNDLKELSENFIYIAIRDARYVKGVKYLRTCETIGVAILGADVGRCAPVDLLVISSWDQVFIFDLLLFNLKTFPGELKFLLETPDIAKVVHDSRALVDAMFHRYRINVNNIFDTFVATQMLTGSRLTLNECLSRFFHFPDALIKYAIGSELKPVWAKRPLDVVYKQYAAKNVQYLIFLKNYLQAELLSEFHAKVAQHSRSTLDFSPLDASRALEKLNI